MSLKVQAFLLAMVFSGSAFAADLGFHDESELGVAIVSGNTTSETYNVKQANTYGWDLNLVKFNARYLNTKSTAGAGSTQTGLTDTARSWDGTLRYERILTENLNVFAAYGLESDVFNGYVQKNNLDAGGKYFIAKSEETTWSAEAGYRNIVTHYPSALQVDSNTSNVRVFSEATQSVSKTATFKLFIEYIQALSSNISVTGYSVAQDYQVNAEPSVTVLMSQVFSVKSSYLFKYMNWLPPTSTATKYLDTIFTTSLVAKF